MKTSIVNASSTGSADGPKPSATTSWRSPLWKEFLRKALSFYRPTGRLEPAPAALAYGALELAALEYQARRGEIILLYAGGAQRSAIGSRHTR